MTGRAIPAGWTVRPILAVRPHGWKGAPPVDGWACNCPDDRCSWAVERPTPQAVERVLDAHRTHGTCRAAKAWRKQRDAVLAIPQYVGRRHAGAAS